MEGGSVPYRLQDSEKGYGPVLTLSKKEADAGHPILDVAKVQQRTAAACDIALKTVGRFLKAAKSSIAALGSVLLKSLGKHSRKSRTATNLDDFHKTAVRRAVLEFHDRTEKCRLRTCVTFVLEVQNVMKNSSSEESCDDSESTDCTGDDEEEDVSLDL
ncbi:Uncharacterized protein GBIM_17467 [Gryllus bimaculatus]|nr:Uncharacterized protein GBIM_17467 [Gryllus bimaculatus]